MIKSMTGYGQAKSENETSIVSVEIRTVNHRFCEISIKLPKTFSGLEARVRQIVRNRVARGKVYMTISWDNLVEEQFRMILNQDVLMNYLHIIEQLKEILHVDYSANLSAILQIPDLIKRETAEANPEDVWSLLETTIGNAIHSLEQMRGQEGKNLAEDFQKRIHKIDDALIKIESMAADQMGSIREKMTARIQKLLDVVDINEDRIAMEVAVLSEKADITEECVRTRSHLQQFSAYLQDEKPSGRRFNFLLQEINREVNTLSSKAGNAGISQLVVCVKEELERLREQALNIE
ncbi:MAG: YicC family protein [Candidatus Cloacimonetes bacterium 4572_55]|nr:MAG: YicC family protein [Candidatus Cloacimonetes bacterium 4572_55]